MLSQQQRVSQLGQRDASVHAEITEQLMRSGSKQVRPVDMRSGWADCGRIDGNGLRAM
jgi:hypothetical protein